MTTKLENIDHAGIFGTQNLLCIDEVAHF